MADYPANRRVPAPPAAASSLPLSHAHEINDPDKETSVSDGAREKGDDLTRARIRE
jgi:hypothetical protein